MTHLTFELRTHAPESLIPALQRMTEAVACLRERTPAEIVVRALGPRMRELGATLADAAIADF